MIFQYLQHVSFDNLVGGFEKWTMFSDTDKVVPPSDVRWFIIPMNYRYNPHSSTLVKLDLFAPS